MFSRAAVGTFRTGWSLKAAQPACTLRLLSLKNRQFSTKKENETEGVWEAAKKLGIKFWNGSKQLWSNSKTVGS